MSIEPNILILIYFKNRHINVVTMLRCFMKQYFFLLPTIVFGHSQINATEYEYTTSVQKESVDAEYQEHFYWEKDDKASTIKNLRKSQQHKKYLLRYLYALKNSLPQNLCHRADQINTYHNCIWTLWLQGKDKAPGIVKTCWQSMEKYKNGRQLIILEEADIEKFIHLPQHIWDKYHKKIIPPALFADIVRYCLLYKYGGIWIDSTVWMTGIIPTKIADLDFFMFSIDKYSTRTNVHLTANWFIVSKPNNPILKDLILLNFEYWKHENKMIDYFMNYIFFKISIDNNQKSKEIFNKMPYYPEIIPFYSILRKQYNPTLLSEAKSLDWFPLHKLIHSLKRNYKGSLFEYLSEANTQ